MKRYFISFIHEEIAIASFMRNYLNDLFQQEAQFFLSADSINAGEDWLKRVQTEISQAEGLLSILSNESFYRPWINIETGAFWIYQRKIFPLIYGGLDLSHLHRPLTDMQITYLEDPKSVSGLIRALSEHIGRPAPPPYDAKKFCDSFRELYESLIKVCKTLEQAVDEVRATHLAPQPLEILNIEEDSSLLRYRQIPLGAVEVSGYVADTAVLLIKSVPKLNQQYLIIELENTEGSKSLAFGQMVKVRVNKEARAPFLKQQQHPLDREYVRVKDGFYVYEVENITKDIGLNIELVFWKVALDRLRLRFYVI